MPDLDHIHAAIANLYPGASFGSYLWAQENGEDGLPAGEPVMLRWDQERFGRFDLDLVRSECHRLATVRPPPDTVFDYQFAGQAEAEGIISAEECEAWVGAGKIPPVLLDKVSAVVVDTEAQRRVTLFLMGAKSFPRHHPNTIALAALFGKDTPEKLDAFFSAAGDR